MDLPDSVAGGKHQCRRESSRLVFRMISLASCRLLPPEHLQYRLVHSVSMFLSDSTRGSRDER